MSVPSTSKMHARTGGNGLAMLDKQAKAKFRVGRGWCCWILGCGLNMRLPSPIVTAPRALTGSSVVNEAVCEATPSGHSIQFIDLSLCSHPTALGRVHIIWRRFIRQICAQKHLRTRSQGSHRIQASMVGFGGCKVGTARGISSWPCAHLINDSDVIGGRLQKSLVGAVLH